MLLGLIQGDTDGLDMQNNEGTELPRNENFMGSDEFIEIEASKGG
jgi:hypothetical protein